MDIFYSIIFAFFAGLLPSLLWLWFWLHEDRAHPEPQALIATAFIGGMFAVLISLVLEKIATSLLPGPYSTIFVWAIIEECAKYALASILVLHSRENDEPIDSMIYLISVALGFAALENSLFVLGPILQKSILTAAATIDLRFIGATLLHTICSSAIGVSWALTFNSSKVNQRHARRVGLILAVLLHTAFNLSILYTNSTGMIVTFSFVWLAIIVLILLFEKVKRMKITNAPVEITN